MTAQDFEEFLADLMCTSFPLQHTFILFIFNFCLADEALLRQRIQDLQHWRKIGLKTAADVDKYNTDLEKRVSLWLVEGVPLFTVVNQKAAKANLARDYYAPDRLQLRTGGGRHSTGPDSRRDSEVRELTPKLSGAGAANGNTGSGRKMRT